MDKIDEFIADLAKVESTDSLTNVYAFAEPQSKICRHNLRLYLNRMAEHKNGVILVGEAPGFHGCRLSGIPFTCEYNFTQELIPDIIGKELGYQIVSPDKPEMERSASAVWHNLKVWYERYGSVPLLWNICPFHPHKAGNIRTNRAPSSSEIKSGVPFLKRLIDLFDIQYIGAIGAKASKAISSNGYKCPYLRHPSFGGQVLFENNIRDFMHSVQ